MTDKDKIYLTRQEALEAIHIDFQQYDPQLGMFAKLYPRYVGGSARKTEKDGVAGLLVAAAQGRRFIPEDALGECIFRAVEAAELSLVELAELCETVFWGHAAVGPSPDDAAEQGIWLETGIERFSCHECGLCCYTLDHRCSCTEDDRRRWKEAGREDILEWVGDVLEDGEWLHDRLWVHPGTNLPVEHCPWMEKRADGGFSCGIHDIKPDVCFDYPGSVKHGALTGCYCFAEERRKYREGDRVSPEPVRETCEP